MLFDRDDLRSDQHKMADYIKLKRYCAIWLKMRGGKTAACLTAIQDLYDNFEIAKVLIIAPLRVTANAWPDDCEDWTHITLNYKIIDGTPKQRVKLLKNPAPIHIISRDKIAWLVEHFEDSPWPYDMVVIDESRSFKNHSPETPKGRLTRFGAIRKIRAQVRRLVEFTGTPAPKDRIDLWAQIFLLDGGKRLGKNITAFRDKYCTQGRERYLWELNKGAGEQIAEAVSDIVLSLEGPTIAEADPIDIIVPLPPAARQTYNDMAKHKIITVGNVEIPALSPAIKQGKLAQISCGAIYDLEGETHWVHKEKYKALDELIEDSYSNMILVYNFQFEKDEVLRRHKNCRVLDKKRSTIDDWNAGKTRLLLMHPASGGHGLTLHTGGNVIVWLSPTSDNELYQQVNNRLSHPDKKLATEIYRLLADTQVDRKITASVEYKEFDQQGLMVKVRTN